MLIGETRFVDCRNTLCLLGKGVLLIGEIRYADCGKTLC